MAKATAKMWSLFVAEAKALSAGMEAYASAKKNGGRGFLLRRNTHRLEKGLAMPVRRSAFGAEYIGETVETYLAVTGRDEPTTPSLRWTSDVLRAYFACVEDSDDRIATARARWSQLRSSAQNEEQGQKMSVPRPVSELFELRPLAKGSVPDLEAFTRLCYTRRSVRWFEDRAVDMVTVRAAMSAALQAPSACNRQPYDFFVLTDKEQIAEVAGLPLGARGFGADLPCLVAVVGDLSAFSETRDRNLIYIDSSLAAMSFMLALTSAGLGSVPINWPDLPKNHVELRRILGLSPWQVPIMLIGLGYPDQDGMVPFSEKRGVEEILHEI